MAFCDILRLLLLYEDLLNSVDLIKRRQKMHEKFTPAPLKP